MAKFRKKPVVIEAFKWTGDRHQVDDPVWAIEAIKAGVILFENSGTPGVVLVVKKLEGHMKANRGDWIICGVKGEIYPCKPDIFEATYEAVVSVGDLDFSQTVPSRVGEEWRRDLVIGWRKEADAITAGEYWVRWTSPGGLYYWLHPIEGRWVGEPEQITMPTWPTKAKAEEAARNAERPKVEPLPYGGGPPVDSPGKERYRNVFG